MLMAGFAGLEKERGIYYECNETKSKEDEGSGKCDHTLNWDDDGNFCGGTATD